MNKAGLTKQVEEATLPSEIVAAARGTRKGAANHPIEFRRELAKLACELDTSIARLALKRGSSMNLLFKWRRAYQVGQYEPPALVPV